MISVSKVPMSLINLGLFVLKKCGLMIFITKDISENVKTCFLTIMLYLLKIIDGHIKIFTTLQSI